MRYPHLISELAALGGKGDPSDWREALGAHCDRILASVTSPRELADEWIARSPFRPTPADLAALAADMHPPERIDSNASRGCQDCSNGYRTGRSLRRLDDGRLVESPEIAFACDCQRGQDIAHGPVGKAREGSNPLRVTTWLEADVRLRAELLVTRESGRPGLIAWLFTSRDCAGGTGGWPLWLYADPEAERERRQRAARRFPMRALQAAMQPVDDVERRWDGGAVEDAEDGQWGPEDAAVRPW